jgi:predicted PurR-regulated permease PerM
MGPRYSGTLIPDVQKRSSTDGWITRPRAVALALCAATGIALFLCYRLVSPFLPALAWALALAVIAHPLHRRIKQRVSHSELAAGLSAALAAVVVVVPVVFVSNTLVREAARYASSLQDSFTTGRWQETLKPYPRIERLVLWLEPGLASRPGEVKQETGEPAAPEKSEPTATQAKVAEGAADLVTSNVGTVVTATAWIGMQLFITFMTLFFFLRDRHRLLDALRAQIPLSNTEVDNVFCRVDDTIHATIYGSLVVALVQGVMGGLIFWWLKLASPLFWGSVMGLLAVVPVLGTFVIWAPTALYLALNGEWGRAALLTGWGAIAIGLIDNFLYPFLVGKRIQFHTLLVFFAIAGGVMAFGASGVILGPLVLAVTDALIAVWRHRTSGGGKLDCAPATNP